VRLGRPRPAGFTLIEMIAVLAILGVLAAVAVPMLELAARRAQEQALREGLRQIRTALDAYKAAADAGRIARPREGGASGWPPSLEILEQGAPLVDARGERLEGEPRLRLLRRLPRDPFADPALPAAATWGLRSSDSPPDDPRPGADVFDVHSRSERRALDGTPYRQW
jgi:general secretion pathway protein G